MNKRILGLALLTISLSFSVKAQTFNKIKLDSLLDMLAANNKSMGSLAISQNGHIVYQRAVGYSTTDSLPAVFANIKTKYRIGSISKVFTGVIFFQLIEEGKITLATTLDTYYPQMPNASKITMSQLLSHHSGLFSITSDPDFGSYMLMPQTHEQLLAKMAALKPNFEPGAKYEYSNTNFILLSYIIEKVTNKPYAEVVKQRVINKAGLKDTYYGGRINPVKNEARPYNFAGTWKQVPESDMSIPSGAGAMVSTPTDLDKFIEALFAGKLISTASLEKMKPMNEGYGMAMGKAQFEDKVSYGHNGAIDAFRSALQYFPQDKLAIAYTSNGGTYSPERVLEGALSIYFNKPFIVPAFKSIAIKTEELDKYLGIYASPGLPLKITIFKNK